MIQNDEIKKTTIKEKKEKKTNRNSNDKFDLIKCCQF